MYRDIFNSVFLLTRHSSVFQIMSRNWSTAKCRRRKSSDMWDYIVISATLFVSFLSKSKATNVFSKHILKSKACDKSIQARKKLFCHVIIKNYLCNVLRKFLIKFESTWRREIKEQALQLTLLYCGRTVRSSHRRFCIKKAVLKAVLYKKIALFKKGNTGVFLWILQIFKTTYFEKHPRTAAFWLFQTVYCYMGLKFQGLDCITASGFKVTGPVFCF